MIGCPVQVEAVGVDLGACGLAVTHRVTTRCEGGCPVKLLRVCRGHADVLRDVESLCCCLECDRQGIHSRVTPVSVEALS